MVEGWRLVLIVLVRLDGCKLLVCHLPMVIDRKLCLSLTNAVAEEGRAALELSSTGGRGIPACRWGRIWKDVIESVAKRIVSRTSRNRASQVGWSATATTDDREETIICVPFQISDSVGRLKSRCTTFRVSLHQPLVLLAGVLLRFTLGRCSSCLALCDQQALILLWHARRARRLQ